jgi:hypothetical protein
VGWRLSPTLRVCVCALQLSKSFFFFLDLDFPFVIKKKKIKRFEDHDKCSTQIVQRIIRYDSCVFKYRARPNFLSVLINFIEVDF